MKATKRNKYGKPENNKRVKDGDCIFPFKYKWTNHDACSETERGEICATSINPKTRTMVTYGYCDNSYTKPHHRTMKRKRKLKRKLKLDDDIKITSPSKRMKRYNEEFIDALNELEDIM